MECYSTFHAHVYTQIAEVRTKPLLFTTVYMNVRCATQFNLNAGAPSDLLLLLLCAKTGLYDARVAV